MKPLENAKLLMIKGFMFLLAGALASGLLLLEIFTPKRTLLLVLVVWSFCRFYYFIFYVIEKYVDGAYRFSGVGSFIIYLLKKR